MLVQERYRRILDVLEINTQISAHDLSAILGVSRETVRRDLQFLEDNGQVNRVHGGAVLPSPQSEAPFERRKLEHVRAKTEIARKAAQMVPPGSSLFVDTGTTTAVFGQELVKLSNIMIVTNSVEIAMAVRAAQSDLELVLLGGKITGDIPATIGEMTLAEIKRFNLDFAFIGPVSIDPVKGAFSYHMHEADIARAMIDQSNEAIALADHSKLCATNRIKICETLEINSVISDSKVKAVHRQEFAAAGLNLTI